MLSAHVSAPRGSRSLAEWNERVMVPRLVGFASYCLWLLMMFYSIALYNTEGDFRSILYLNQFISLICLIGTLFGMAHFVKKADKWVLSKRVIYPCMAVLAVATIGEGLVSHLAGWQTVLLVGCAIATGIASGLLFLGWFRLYSDAGSRLAAVEVSAGWVLGCLGCIFLFYMPRVATLVLTAAAALLSGFLLRSSALSRPDRPVPMREHKLRPRTRNMFIRGGIAAAGFGLVDGFSDLMMGYRYVDIPASYDVVLMAVGAVVCAAVLAMALFSKQNAAINMYRIVFLCMVVGCLGIPFLKAVPTIPSALVFGGYFGFLSVLIFICTDISNYFDVPAAKVIGYALAAQYCGEIVGLGLAFVLTSIGPAASDAVFNGVSFALAGILILVNLFLFTEKDMIETSIGEMIDVEAETEEQSGQAYSPEEDIARTVAAMKERYGLSARESDVLPLLIKGRTIARIQEELFISQGTVSTHIRHIYQKTGVHNRQGLLDLIDETDFSAEE